MVASNIAESTFCKGMITITITTFFIICFLYKLEGFILIFLCSGGFFTRFLLALVGNFIIIIFVIIYIWAVGSYISFLATFKTGCTFQPVVIFSITVTSICAILCKLDSVRWWSCYL